MEKQTLKIETSCQEPENLEKIIKETIVACNRFERDLKSDPSFAYNVAEAQARFMRALVEKLTRTRQSMDKTNRRGEVHGQSD